MHHHQVNIGSAADQGLRREHGARKKYGYDVIRFARLLGDVILSKFDEQLLGDAHVFLLIKV